MLEKTIQSNIIDYLKRLPQCTAENVHGSKFQVGRPDINACYKGVLIRIEVKTADHGNKPSDIQIANLKQWAKAGAVCFVAYSLEEVKWVINKEGIACAEYDSCAHCPVNKKYCFTHGGFEDAQA